MWITAFAPFCRSDRVVVWKRLKMTQFVGNSSHRIARKGTGLQPPVQSVGSFCLQIILNMEQGWIKLHRKLKEKGYYSKPNYVFLWIHLLLSANHKPQEFMWNGSMIIVKEGQLITGRRQLSIETGIPATTIERILKMLESEHQIGQQKTTKYRLITIVKWNDYQKVDSVSDNKRTTNGQQTDTNKNVRMKEGKKEPASQDDALIPVVIDLFREVNPSYQRLFGMPPQRSASERLIKQYGLEKLTSMISYLPKSNASKFAPTITTPVQFEQKLGELIAWSRKQKDIKQTKVAFV